jgi:prepilin-type N-terminal cleavage/methylation domain-containing protein/prepilin-type processing-associated H-X9-DG protein
MFAGPQRHRQSRSVNGFTLIELLVVITIIALMIAILLPALAASRAVAVGIQCGSQQRQIGIAMAAYEVDNGGYVTPSMNAATPFWIQSLRIYVGLDDLPPEAGLGGADQRYFDVDRVGIYICPSTAAFFRNQRAADPTVNRLWYLPNYWTMKQVKRDAAGNVQNHADPLRHDAMDQPSIRRYLYCRTMEFADAEPGKYAHANGRTAGSLLRVGNNHLAATNILFADGHVESDRGIHSEPLSVLGATTADETRWFAYIGQRNY